MLARFGTACLEGHAHAPQESESGSVCGTTTTTGGGYDRGGGDAALDQVFSVVARLPTVLAQRMLQLMLRYWLVRQCVFSVVTRLPTVLALRMLQLVLRHRLVRQCDLAGFGCDLVCALGAALAGAERSGQRRRVVGAAHHPRTPALPAAPRRGGLGRRGDGWRCRRR
jgi:hypothetical protein